MNSRGHQLVRVVLALVAGAGIAGGVGAANAATHCGLPDGHRVVHCSNGDRQFVDGRGHLVTVNRMGVVVRDLPPGQAWY